MTILDMPENVTAFFEFVQIGNDLTGGLMGVGLLLAVALVSLFIFSSGKWNQGLIASSFLTFVIGIFFYYLEFISSNILIMTVVYFTIAIIMSFSMKGGAEV